MKKNRTEESTKNQEEAVNKIDSAEIASYITAAILLSAVLVFKLLAALFIGLLINQTTLMLAKKLHIGKLRDKHAKMTAVALISALVIILVAFPIYIAIHYVSQSNGNISSLLEQMAHIVDQAQEILPEAIASRLPENTDEISSAISTWLRQHSNDLQTIGTDAGLTIAQMIIGIVIGAMAALRQAVPRHNYAPLAGALAERTRNLADSFRSVVFAQIRIATINAFFTGIYLVVVLPYSGINLPFIKLMILLTFLLGLIPIIGNLISNTIIVTVSLSHSLAVAMSSLVFLIIIHKLEYFLNAHIVGTRINAHAWEILCAMLLIEAMFGMPGLIAAPVYYAYLKKELTAQHMI